MTIEFSKYDLLILCLILSISFFLLGLTVDNSYLQEAIKVNSERLVPIYKVNTDQKKVAITLDGMWGAKKTPQLLQIFRKYDVKITFFFGGNWLEENPNLVKEIAASGHEVENHSYTHPHMTKLGVNSIKKELQRTSELIEKLTGEKPNLFRPPFGEYDNQLIKTCRNLGYHVIQWSIDSLDWKDVSADFIVNRVLKNVSSGDIILMHNNGANTPQALEKLIPKLQQKGYEIVPVSELIYQENYYIEPHNGLQKKVR
ncbi:putative xylanase/chitin deacetylase [Halobacteroides halobius DSM 5150]|uniref:Putative xylanase/chitin deacetylase n=1 Tax=Halobacteroides halobius (strain ATCC 35273 / DSM 5150 / MD-1) TaxID=748449 RepID=L0K6N2_HALHC|nr:polysaccharide deacetylase family protein [Halobacteroides halobius]AGB40686.1 putative xylanase/chitin deacetylase [Halobacteroides halobius DSM 5150]